MRMEIDLPEWLCDKIAEQAFTAGRSIDDEIALLLIESNSERERLEREIQGLKEKRCDDIITAVSKLNELRRKGL